MYDYNTLDDDMDFSKVIMSIQDGLSNKSKNIKKQMFPEISIRENDIQKLSEYEKKILSILSEVVSLVAEKKSINWTYFLAQFDKIVRMRGDFEKEYLAALFFPEKIRSGNPLVSLSTATYTFTQKITIYTKVNKNGCFLAQVVLPLMLEKIPANSSMSNLYLNIGDVLNGQLLDNNNANYSPQNTYVIPGVFSSYVLQAAKLSCEYCGNRELNSSGFLGGSFSLSPNDKKYPDFSASIFENVLNGINPINWDVLDGLNILYYPVDYNSLSLGLVNDTGTSISSLNYRMNIYGVGLPTSVGLDNSSTIKISLCMIWNTIPTIMYQEILPLDAGVSDFDSMLKSSKFIAKSGLLSFKKSEIPRIEKMLMLPTYIRNESVKDLNSTLGNSIFTRRTILDELGDSVGSDIQPIVTLSENALVSKFLKKGGYTLV